MADNIDGRETSRTFDLILRELLIVHFCDFLRPCYPFSSSPWRFIPFLCLPGIRNRRLPLETRANARGKDAVAKERKRWRYRHEREEKDRQKAEANGVTWPKDAKLPKRSTRKAWSAPITEPLLAAIMIIAYLERERSCARTRRSAMRVWAYAACTYTRAYTGCPAIIYYCYFLSI